MMDKRKHRRITVNTSELTIIRKIHGTAQANCLQCGSRVDMVTPEQGVTLTGIASRVIYGWVENAQVHFLETAEGYLFVCLNSLQAKQQAEQQIRQTLPP